MIKKAVPHRAAFFFALLAIYFLLADMPISEFRGKERNGDTGI
jgi:hypothetical protein